MLTRGKAELEEAVLAEGGVAAAMRTRQEWLAHPQAAAVAAAELVELGPLVSDTAGTPGASAEPSETGSSPVRSRLSRLSCRNRLRTLRSLRRPSEVRPSGRCPEYGSWT